MDKNIVLNSIYKNRLLIICCAALIFGTISGISVLKIIPNDISENLFDFISISSKNTANIFLNRFSFSFLVLIGLFLSGTSTVGSITAYIMIFINGLFFGFENALNYNHIGVNYIITSIVVFFSSKIFIDFMLVIMAENAIVQSRQLVSSVSQYSSEKPHYNAKRLCVKFFTFTVCFAIISAFSAFFIKFIQSVV